MDLITLAQLNKLKKSGGVGYAEEQYETVKNATAVFKNGKATISSAVNTDLKFNGTEKIYEIGHKSYVYWDGKLYVCETVPKTGDKNLCIGNQARKDGTGDTGEPFCLWFGSIGIGCLEALDDIDNGVASSTHTIKICDKLDDLIHPIDPKFIPGAVLPVVEITTQPTSAGAKLTEAESAMMDAVSVNRMPIIVSYTDKDGQTIRMVFLCGYYQGETFTSFQYGFGTLLFVLDNYEGMWKFYSVDTTEA